MNENILIHPDFYIFSFILVIGIWCVYTAFKLDSLLNDTCKVSASFRKATKGILVIGTIFVTSGIFMLLNIKHISVSNNVNVIVILVFILVLSIVLVSLLAIVKIKDGQEGCTKEEIISINDTGNALLIASSLTLSMSFISILVLNVIKNKDRIFSVNQLKLLEPSNKLTRLEPSNPL